MSAGVFQTFQPQYTAQRIATFPVVNKRPAVRGYARIGLRASGELARRKRPWDPLPIDLLGTGGFAIGPPSATQRGCYEFIEGGLDDVARLPSMRGLNVLPKDAADWPRCRYARSRATPRPSATTPPLWPQPTKASRHPRRAQSKRARHDRGAFF
jgi:hypothetical protein